MKTNVLSKSIQEAYLPNTHDLYAFDGLVTVFDGPENYLRRIDDPLGKIDANCILFMRETTNIRYPVVWRLSTFRPCLSKSNRHKRWGVN